MFSPRRTQRGRAATKENGNFHHEARAQGKEIRRNFVPNFVLFVSFVVICKFSQSAQIFNYSNTKSTKERRFKRKAPEGREEFAFHSFRGQPSVAAFSKFPA